ncbi:hypothetical protein GSI_04123 [Ganoderma sinense ZZ0214-1]|uniref:Uncharacterized protein n=1 Tax=Ganoderma sinense ZZ0214-1 TaxID=1077348 RepID=A0A2G8SIC2_9APHY|nr:hypothetical protein GSI_04123 [Ganoderma sinense ZZ0214-1]
MDKADLLDVSRQVWSDQEVISKASQCLFVRRTEAQNAEQERTAPRMPAMAYEGSFRQHPFPDAAVDVLGDKVQDMLVYLEGKGGFGGHGERRG